jgi:acetyltransferase-like isoleucine patch superfamily enzyme
MDRLRALLARLSALRLYAERKLLLVLSNDFRIRRLRAHGARIGENCLVFTTHFSAEPYLVEIGNHVAISAGTKFITHDASGWLFEDTDPHMDLLGTIHVGDNTYFGLDVLVLPNTRIGANCIIGTGAVVRGDIPDGSVVMGNPGRIVMKTSLIRPILLNHKNRLDSRHLPRREKEALVRRHFGLS